jgi:hypothetical protein
MAAVNVNRSVAGSERQTTAFAQSVRQWTSVATTVTAKYGVASSPKSVAVIVLPDDSAALARGILAATLNEPDIAAASLSSSSISHAIETFRN